MTLRHEEAGREAHMITLAILGAAAYATTAAVLCWVTGPVSRRR
jgi:hypothetical protein